MSKIFTEWFRGLFYQYAEYSKQASQNRCKIVGIETDNYTGKNKLLVKIIGIKSQMSISYFPEELVANDAMLREFSQADVRAITFYALNNSPKSDPAKLRKNYRIISQEFLDNQTLFVFKEVDANEESRMLANELYSNADLLKRFQLDDLINIISTAVQEQTIKDMDDCL